MKNWFSEGGSIRNIGGVLAQRKLTRSIISALRVAGKSYEWLHSETNTWIPMSEYDAEIGIFCKRIPLKKRQRKPYSGL
ncbi:MAG: hypothetical protein EX330_05130 [Candidatus Brocadia sp. BROELEC01]|nr:hypothetical protein [Candidatus Brocadia sapporoensis]QQR66386.1 MAG: hypothetical protein IPI25_12860 [Candidatus Brocadia sp.]RZV58702.1 MAG: hypothetical protein EX330_05130 [Candidatus Brocadia sp. BROELEC01]